VEATLCRGNVDAVKKDDHTIDVPSFLLGHEKTEVGIKVTSLAQLRQSIGVEDRYGDVNVWIAFCAISNVMIKAVERFGTG
jgi:hypothetical protein